MGNEPILINNRVIGRVKSAGQGYTIKKAIAYAYLPVENTKIGTKVDIEMFGIIKTATVQEEPLLDPQGLRIKSQPQNLEPNYLVSAIRAFTRAKINLASTSQSLGTPMVFFRTTKSAISGAKSAITSELQGDIKILLLEAEAPKT